MNAILVGLLVASAAGLVAAQAAEQTAIKVGGSPAQTGVLKYNGNDFEQFVNPSNRDSDWAWMTFNAENAGKYVADSGKFVRNKLTSVPFRKYVAPNTGRVGILSVHEALIGNKHKIQVRAGHQVSVQATFQVKLHNVEKQPFGRQAVANVSDDPRIASAGLSLVSSGERGLRFSILATDRGLWAFYARHRPGLIEHPERNDKIFAVFRRLADRASPDERINGAIVYDRDQNAVHFKLNDVALYTIENIGTLPRGEPGNVALTANRPDLVRVEPTEFVVQLGLHSYLDEIDPNNPTSPLRLQRLTSDLQVYDEKAQFVDTTGDEKKLFGLGAEMSVFDVVIKHEKTDQRNKVDQKKQ